MSGDIGVNILVTGGTGFLGTHLIPLLKRRGDTVLGLARSDSASRKLKEMGVRPVEADITSGQKLSEALSSLQVDAVFHLAAEIASQRNRSRLRAVNVQGTRNVYEAVRGHGELRKFVFASTVVTGEAEGALLVEDKALHVETEYGRTKQAAERILLDAFGRDGFPAIILRPCHIYGPGGWFGDVVRSTKKGRMRVPGNGRNLWDMIHVDDCAQALVAALEHGQPGEIYHCSDGTPITMGEVVEEVARLVGVRKPGSAPRFVANLLLGRDTVTSVVRSARTSNEKLRGLGWEPLFPDSKPGLAATIRAMGL